MGDETAVRIKWPPSWANSHSLTWGFVSVVAIVVSIVTRQGEVAQTALICWGFATVHARIK